MRKILIPLFALAISAMLVCGSVVFISADNSNESDIPDDAIVTYGVLREYLEQFKQEILQSAGTEGGNTQTQSAYNDISVTKGQVIYLSTETEIIFRGGNAIAVTASAAEGAGISDMSAGTEIFSGEQLEYGHIYYLTETDSKAAILILSEKAFITVRGSYEIG